MARNLTPPRVLFVTSEINPLMKTGGLGEVSGALPRALNELGADVRVLLPGYPQIVGALEDSRVVHRSGPSAALPAADLLQGRLPDGPPCFVIDCPALYLREGGPYQDADGNDWPDNALRFGLLSWIAALLSSDGSPLLWRPEIAHCNDWQ